MDLRHDYYLNLKIGVVKECGEQCRGLRGFDRMRCVIECNKARLGELALYKRASQEIFEVGYTG